jgi:hypothetical protein
MMPSLLGTGEERLPVVFSSFAVFFALDSITLCKS